MVAVLAAALVLVSTVAGQARERTTIFVPSQPIAGVPGATVPAGGATVTCDGGPPFVLFVDFVSGPTSGGTCTFEHLGRPGGNFVCDDPTTLFIRILGQEIADIPISAFVCSGPVDEEQEAAQPSPAPITQEGDQESEAGEIDQSFEVS
jgi:hypothetical protein